MKPVISDVARLRVLLPCLSCGDAGVLELALDEAGQLHCTNCDASFDFDAARQHIAEWQTVLSWYETLRRDHNRLRDRTQRN